jgi:hypothetical protein
VTGSITSGLVLSGEERLSFSEKISEAELWAYGWQSDQPLTFRYMGVVTRSSRLWFPQPSSLPRVVSSWEGLKRLRSAGTMLESFTSSPPVQNLVFCLLPSYKNQVIPLEHITYFPWGHNLRSLSSKWEPASCAESYFLEPVAPGTQRKKLLKVKVALKCTTDSWLIQYSAHVQQQLVHWEWQETPDSFPLSEWFWDSSQLPWTCGQVFGYLHIPTNQWWETSTQSCYYIVLTELWEYFYWKYTGD